MLVDENKRQPKSNIEIQMIKKHKIHQQVLLPTGYCN